MSSRAKSVCILLEGNYMKPDHEKAARIHRIESDQEAAHIQRMKWVLSFCHPNFDLKRSNAEERERLKYKIFEFIEDSNLQGTDYDPMRMDNPTGPPGEFVASIDDRTLEEIQRELRTGLNDLIDNKGAHVFVMRPKGDRFKEPTISCVAWGDSHTFQISILFKNDPVGKALSALILHAGYSRLTAQRLRRCPICQTLFLRDERKPQKGREAYCSPTCRQTAATRKRAATKAETAARQAAAAES